MSKKIQADDFLPVAEILKPFGVRGEVKVRLICDDFEDFCDCLSAGEVYITRDLSRGRAPRLSSTVRRLDIESVHQHGSYVLVAFDQIETPEEADALRGLLISVPVDALPPTDEGSFYFYELEGMDIFDEKGEKIGTVSEVLENPAHEMIVVAPLVPGEKPFLIPFAEVFVRKVDTQANRIDVSLPEGFIEAQR